MPHFNITSSDKGNNKGSCRALVYYLEKENYLDEKQNQLKPVAEREYFFSESQDQVAPYKVIDHIDNNKKKLGAKDDKFFLVNISPSQEELKHINNDEKKLKAYTKAVMDIYAQNFNKGLHSKDLVWYAKLERNRSYKHTDRAVQLGEKQKGDLKEGLNTHIQVIVSRKDANNKIKLSPLNHSRKENTNRKIKGNTGFDRVNFKMKSIEKFDQMFEYKRLVNELERHQVMKYGTKEEKEVYQKKQTTREKPIIQSPKSKTPQQKIKI